MARNSFGNMSDGADRLFSREALSVERISGEAALAATFCFAIFLGAVLDFGKAPNRFGRGLKLSPNGW
jgi:hypothetical protein